MLVGGHLANQDQPSEVCYRRVKLMKARVVGTLWTDGTRHRRHVYERLEADLGAPVYIVRVGPSGRTTVQQWLRDASDALAEIPPAAILTGRVRVRILNEVNLAAEGAWPVDDYSALVVQVREFWEYPDVQLVLSPLSLGLAGWQDYLRDMTVPLVLRAVNGVAVNAYAHLVPEAIAAYRNLGKPLDVTEINTLELSGKARAHWIVDRAKEWAAAGASTLQVFIVDGADPTNQWDDRYILTDEEAEEIGRLTGGEIDPEEPAMPPSPNKPALPDLVPFATFTPLTRNFDREGTAPKIAVWHGTGGLGDPYGWWNRVAAPHEAASADLWIAKNGDLKQYVKLVSQTSWSNGPLVKPDLSVPFIAWLVRYKRNHPEFTGNWWTVSIECEKGPDNADPLTPAQIKTGNEVARFLRDEYAIPLDRHHHLGHYQFDSVSRGRCPRFTDAEWAQLLSPTAKPAAPAKPTKAAYEAGAWVHLNAGGQWLLAHGDVVDRQDGRDVIEVLDRSKKRHGG